MNNRAAKNLKIESIENMFRPGDRDNSARRKNRDMCRRRIERREAIREMREYVR